MLPLPLRKGTSAPESSNVVIAKQDLHFDFNLKVTIHELTDLQSYEGKSLFVVFNVSTVRSPVMWL